MYKVTFKLGRKVHTWYRFAPHINAALVSALKALDEEFSGKANLISVAEMNTEEIDAVKSGKAWVH